MKYDAIAKLVSSQASSSCASRTLTITPSGQEKSLTFFITAATDYDQTKGNAENGYSFRGSSPGPAVETVASSATNKSYDDLLARHLKDYTSLQASFSLNLPDSRESADKDTATLLSRYSASDGGDPYLEALLFDYSRHLLISSARQDSLPPNLQGRWTEELKPAWSSDYHVNINLQMNYWAAAQTGQQDSQVALWNHMEHTWVPRGTETAKALYGAPGYVFHDELNIFGFTGMKDAA